MSSMSRRFAACAFFIALTSTGVASAFATTSTSGIDTPNLGTPLLFSVGGAQGMTLGTTGLAISGTIGANGLATLSGGVTTGSNGNVTTNTMALGGVTLGSPDAATLASLRAAPVCGANGALTKTAANTLDCSTASSNLGTPVNLVSKMITVVGAAQHDAYITAANRVSAGVGISESGTCNWKSDTATTNWNNNSNPSCMNYLCWGYYLDNGITTLANVPQIVSTSPSGSCAPGVYAAACSDWQYGGAGQPLAAQYPPVESVTCLIAAPNS